MKDPLYLTRFYADAAPETPGVILETPTDKTTTKAQAELQNRLAETGRCETLLAGTPHYWQRKLARALVVGAGAGVTVTLCISLLIPG